MSVRQIECQWPFTDKMTLSLTAETEFTIMIILLLIVLTLSSCSGGTRPEEASFPYVQIPQMTVGTEMAGTYAAEHFWDPFFEMSKGHLGDTSTIGGLSKSAFEGGFADFVNLLWQLPNQMALDCQKKLVDRAEKIELERPENPIWNFLLELEEHYFSNPQSPFRSEELYLPVIEKLIATPLTSEAEKEAFTSLYRYYSLNRIGCPAADFPFTTASGRTMRLHQVESDLTILLFSNPGCHECKATIDALKSDRGIEEMIRNGYLKIVNIYPDSDVEAWKEYLPNYPQEWINGFEESGLLRDGGLYNMRAIPSIYLLDGEKRVIMKDVPVEKVLTSRQ